MGKYIPAKKKRYWLGGGCDRLSIDCAAGTRACAISIPAPKHKLIDEFEQARLNCSSVPIPFEIRSS